MSTSAESTSGVYLIRNTVSGKRYVGSAQDMGERWRKHQKLLKSGKHHSKELQIDFLLQGEGDFVFQPLLICASRDLLFFEQRAIDKFDAVATGYNTAKHAGAPMRGRKHKAETKARMSLVKLGKKQSPEHILARTSSRKGVPPTDEQRETLARARAIQAATPVSEETRKKLSQAGMGREVSEKSRAALITRNKARAGVKTGPMNLSDAEHQRRIDANKARKGEKHGPQSLETKAKVAETYALKRTAGIHSKRWYLHRGLPVPGCSATSISPNQEGTALSPQHPTEQE